MSGTGNLPDPENVIYIFIHFLILYTEIINTSHKSTSDMNYGNAKSKSPEGNNNNALGE